MPRIRNVPIASAVEAIQRMHEVQEVPKPYRLGAVGQLIAKIKGLPRGKRLLVFDAPLSRRSTAGSIASKLRKAGIEARTRKVGESVRVFVLT